MDSSDLGKIASRLAFDRWQQQTDTRVPNRTTDDCQRIGTPAGNSDVSSRGFPLLAHARTIPSDDVLLSRRKFSLSGVLAGVGMVSITRNGSRRYRMLAAVPFLFAAQQAAEGIVWLTLSRADQIAPHRLAVIAFLGIAFIVWPVWVSLAFRAVERTPDRRHVLTALAMFGLIVSVSSAVLLTRWRPIAAVAGHSIR